MYYFEIDLRETKIEDPNFDLETLEERIYDYLSWDANLEEDVYSFFDMGVLRGSFEELSQSAKERLAHTAKVCNVDFRLDVNNKKENDPDYLMIFRHDSTIEYPDGSIENCELKPAVKKVAVKKALKK